MSMQVPEMTREWVDHIEAEDGVPAFDMQNWRYSVPVGNEGYAVVVYTSGDEYTYMVQD